MFASSQFNKDEILSFVPHISNCIVVGCPKLDLYHMQYPPKDKKTILIYAPHHSFEDDGLCLATFKENGREILKTAQKLGDRIHWIFKPHPRFKHAVILNKIMTEKEIDQYYFEWEKMGCIYEKGDYIGLFEQSDGLITDCCSFLAEYLPSKHPVFHLRNTKASFNALGAALSDVYYAIYSVSELETELNQVVLLRNDHKEKERLAMLKEIYDPKENVAIKVLTEIKNILN